MGGMIKCLNCKTTIHSMHRHDFISCECGDDKTRIFVDGGFDYTRMGGNPEDIEIIGHTHGKDKEGKDEVTITDSWLSSLM